MTPSRYPRIPLAPSPGRALKGVLVLCAFLSLGWAFGTGAQEAGTVSDGDRTEFRYKDPLVRAAEILDKDFQTELPTLEPPAESERKRPAPATLQVFLPNIMVKIGLVLGGILLLVVIINIFYSKDPWTGEDDSAEAENGSFDFDRLNLGDPDRLAADGHYAEAIHAMLLRALALSAGRLNLIWPHSLTSREILGSASLTDQAREHLNDLVTRVEIHHFGGRPPQADDFHHCRLVYERLAADPIRGRS